MTKLALRGYIANFFLVSRLYSVLTIKITQGMKNVCVSDTFEIFGIFEILAIFEISNGNFG